MTNQDSKVAHPEQQHLAEAKVLKKVGAAVDDRVSRTLKVRATNRGYIDFIRNAGEEFDIPDHLFSAEWMEDLTETATPQR